MPTSVKTGDRVLLPGWGGNAIKLGEEVRGSAPGSSFLLLFKEIDELFFFFGCRNTSCSRIRRFWLRLRSRERFYVRPTGFFFGSAWMGGVSEAVRFLFSALRVAESERKKLHRKVCLISLIVMG